MTIDWGLTNAACEKLDPEQDALAREVVTQLADKWTLGTLAVLAEAGAPMRFSRVMEKVEGVSQKSLTKTLRQMERDGLVTRVHGDASPTTDAARGGVVVIHHMPGYDRATKEITRRFAELGYDAICPNLYYREAPGADPDDAAATVRAAGGVPDDRLVGDVAGAAEYLRKLDGANGKIGVYSGRKAVEIAQRHPSPEN